MTNKNFWNTMRLFLTNKGIISENENLFLRRKKRVSSKSKAAEMFNVSYKHAKVVKNSPTSVLDKKEYKPVKNFRSFKPEC